jgi:cytochrome c
MLPPLSTNKSINDTSGMKGRINFSKAIIKKNIVLGTAAVRQVLIPTEELVQKQMPIHSWN